MLPKEGVLHAYIPDIPGKERRKAAPGKEGLLGVEGMRPEIILQALRDAGLGERVSFDPIPGADHEDKLFFTDENLDRVRAFLERTMKEE